MQATISGSLTASPDDPQGSRAGYVVVAYLIQDNEQLASARTDGNGAFSLLVDVVDGDAVCAFRVLRDDQLILDTGWNLTWTLRAYLAGLANQQTPTLSIALPPIAGNVFGYVRNPDGSPVTCTARLFLVSLPGQSTEVANVAVSANGTYALGPVADGDMVMVQATVPSGGNLPTVIASSTIHVGRGRIDLVVPAGNVTNLVGTAEFDDVSGAVEALRGSVAVEDLTADQVAFIAGRTGLRPAVLTTFTRAKRLCLDASPTLAHDFVYALGRLGLPMTRIELASHRDRLAATLALAVAQNLVVGRDFSADLANIGTVLETRTTTTPAFAGALAASSPTLTSSHVATLAAAYSTHVGTTAEYWANLRTAGVSNTVIDAAQEALRLEQVADGHAPLVTALLNDHANWSTPADLAARSESAWLSMVQALPSLPPGYAGTTAEQQAAYAKTVRDVLARAYPTRSLVEDLTRADSSFSALATFVASTPGYEIGTSTISKHTSDTSLIAKAEPVERLFRLSGSTNRAVRVQALQAAGFGSALDIVRAGPSAFAASLSSALDVDTVQELFRHAVAQHALTTNVYLRYSPAVGGGGAAAGAGGAVASPPMPSSLVPDWAGLFGGVDFCSCEECQSVLSPAAYLVDLLQFLRQRPTTSSSAASVLDTTSRRADILDIQFTCENTNHALPYIDIVNEILERSVHPPTGGAAAWQTTWAPEDLALHPEHVHAPAYEDLSASSATYPLSLPYDLWLDESRSYLGALGLSRAAVRAALKEADGDGVALERLGLVPGDLDLLTNVTPDEVALWGLTAGTNAITTLGPVNVLMSRAEVDFTTLTQILATTFVGNPTIAFDGARCDLAHASVTWPSDTTAAKAMIVRIARFERLRRRAGFTVAEADRALTLFGLSGLADVGRVRGIASDVGVSFADVLAWLGGIDRRLEADGRSPYERVWVDPARAATHPLRLDGTRNALAIGTPSLSPGTSGNVVAEVAAGLGLTAPRTATLAIALFGASPTADVARLDALHAHVSLSRALGITVEDLTAYLGFLASAPLFSSSTALAQAVRAIAADRRATVFATDVAYLLRGDASALDPADDQVTLALDMLRSTLAKISDAHPAITSALDPIPDPNGALTLKYLRAVYADSPAFATSTTIANDVYDFLTRVTTPSGVATFIDTNFVAFMPAAADRDAAKAVLDPGDPPAVPPASSYIDDPGGRLAWTLPYLVRTRVRRESVGAVVGNLATATGLSVAAASLLLADSSPPSGGVAPPILLHEAGSTTVAALDTFLAVATTSPASDAQRNTFRRLSKVVYLVKKLRLSATELPYVAMLLTSTVDASLFTTHPPAALPHYVFDAIPLSGGAAVHYDTFWSVLRDLVELRDSRSPAGLLDILESAVREEDGSTKMGLVAGRTGWSVDDLSALASSSRLDLAWPGAFKDGTALLRIGRAMEVVNRTGLSAVRVWDWCDWPTDTTGSANRSAQADAIKDAVRARLPKDQYAAGVGPIRNGIRERQRDALIASRRSSDPASSSTLVGLDVLAGRYLVDLAQSPCGMTSRIKLALSSLQTFVQRASLGLETSAGGMDTDLVLSREDLSPWDWMKSYRVWEANRKIFLWPENWIEPELRDDKSPFFRELEAALLKAELNDANVENAFLDYLRNLNQVAQLQVCTICQQPTESGSNALHVFARTRNTPHQYFWRTRQDGAWSAWTKLDFEIDSDHVLAVYHDRRIYLFWANLTEKSYESKDGYTYGPGGTKPTDGTNKDAYQYFEMRLAWSVWFGGRWTKKQVAKEQIPPSTASDQYFAPDNLFSVHFDTEPPFGELPTSYISLIARVLDGGELFIAPFFR